MHYTLACANEISPVHSLIKMGLLKIEVYNRSAQVIGGRLINTFGFDFEMLCLAGSGLLCRIACL
jgi:hypothetical protein